MIHHWRRRKNAELEQAVIRLLLGGALIVYLLASDHDVAELYAAFTAFAALSLFMLAHIYRLPEARPWRRYTGQVIDLTSISIVLYLGGAAGAVGFGIYMWVIVGNGCRYGSRYLVSATALAAVMFPLVALHHPYWQAHTLLATGLWVMQLAVPAYLWGLLNRLDLANQRLDHLSRHDELTGLLNRRACDERLQQEFARLKRQSTDIGLAIVDIDHFKAINDAHGHLTGDAVIQHVASVLKACCREGDVIGRYGGEEFVVLLPGLSPDSVRRVAERLLRSVEDNPLWENGSRITCTISLGVACWQTHYEKVSDWVRDADQALYQAKDAGRNRLVLAEQAAAY